MLAKLYTLRGALHNPIDAGEPVNDDAGEPVNDNAGEPVNDDAGELLDSIQWSH